MYFRLIQTSAVKPDYPGIELGIGEGLVIRAVGESTGRSSRLIKADLKKEGDLGLVAMVSDTLRHGARNDSL